MPARESYDRLRAAHVDAVGAALQDHIERLDWSREQIEHHQTQRLRSLLAYARERSPFHARRLSDIDPSAVTASDLARVPMMTKAQAQEEWDDIVTVADLTRQRAEQILVGQQWFSYTRGDQQIFSSGGSSGVRGVYVWDWQFFVSIACLAWRLQAREERRAPQAPAKLAVLAAATPPHASTPLFDVPTAPGMETVVIPAGAPIDVTIEAVAAAEPTHLVGYATVVGQLARASLAGRLDIRPVRVSTNSEPLLDEDRQAIREAWDAPVHNLWGSTEIGVQAVGCARGEGLHVCEDEVVLERVDESGAPVGPDEPAARTLATGLANRTFPFIRYDLGDQVNWLPGPVRLRKRVRAGGRHRRPTRRRLPLRHCHDSGERVPPRPRHGSASVRVPGAPDRPWSRCSHRGSTRHGRAGVRLGRRTAQARTGRTRCRRPRGGPAAASRIDGQAETFHPASHCSRR